MESFDSESRPMIEKEELAATLAELHERYLGDFEGTVADYIPELAKADPNWFGICCVTPDGTVVEVGDSDRPFTIQSVSKPFVYGMALEDRGRQAVLEKVGVEPTGDAFNSIIRLDEASKRPYNPMVNAGAIATTSLLAGSGPTGRLNLMLERFGRYAGHDVAADMPVFISERSTGHRNRAIAHLMLNFQMIDPCVEEILDLYFQQCSIMVTARDLGVMAATLAHGGLNPLTGLRAVPRQFTRDILSVMFTCGLYDATGEWVYRVGLPAKSGVGGGLIAVSPGRLGIGVFSPLLDDRGSSVRAIRVCQELSARFGLHLFDRALPGASQGESPGELTDEYPAVRPTSADPRVHRFKSSLSRAEGR